MNMYKDSSSNHVLFSLTIEVSTVYNLLRTIEQIEQLTNVISARRTTLS
jgi:(p)ppGpp synthase/HD superfamily hydrolase